MRSHRASIAVYTVGVLLCLALGECPFLSKLLQQHGSPPPGRRRQRGAYPLRGDRRYVWLQS